MEIGAEEAGEIVKLLRTVQLPKGWYVLDRVKIETHPKNIVRFYMSADRELFELGAEFLPDRMTIAEFGLLILDVFKHWAMERIINA